MIFFTILFENCFVQKGKLDRLINIFFINMESSLSSFTVKTMLTWDDEKTAIYFRYIYIFTSREDK